MNNDLKNQDTKNITKSFLGIESKIGKIVLLVSAILVAAVLGFILGLKIFYSSHWYPNTWIGDRDVSGMTCSESAELMDYVYDNFQLNVKGRDGGSLTVTQDEINYQVNIQDSVKEQFDKQHESFPLFSLGKRKQVDLALNAAYDSDKLENILKKSDLYAGSESYPITKPKSAKVYFSQDKQYLDIKKEIIGNTLDFDAYLKTVKNALTTGHEKLDLTDETKNPDVYKKPELTSTDAEIQDKVNACNAASLRWLTWDINGDATETVGPELIYSWCRYENGKVSFKKMAIRNWVEKLCLKYKTVGITRTFKNHAGKKIKVSGGDYGWAFDYESMVDQLMKILKKNIDPKLQQAYMENPDKAQKKALTFTKEPKYANTAFHYDYDNKENDWDKKNFIEISLSSQKVYVWRKGKVVFSCRCISGRPVPERETRKGAYFIKEHQPHRVLKGDDYETPVDNWVRIMWTGTGFHAAPWQPWSTWTKTTYLTRGSHGCLNLAVEDSKKIYKLSKYKEMVFIY